MITKPLREVIEDAVTACRVNFTTQANAVLADVDGCVIAIGAVSPTAIGIRHFGNSITDDFEFKTDLSIHEYVKDFLSDVDPRMITLMYGDENTSEVPFIALDCVEVVTRYQYNKTPVANAWTRDSLKDDPTLNHDSGEEMTPTIVDVDVDSDDGIGVTGSLTLRKMGLTPENPTDTITGEIQSKTGTLLNKPEQDTV